MVMCNTLWWCVRRFGVVGVGEILCVCVRCCVCTRSHGGM